MVVVFLVFCFDVLKKEKNEEKKWVVFFGGIIIEIIYVFGEQGEFVVVDVMSIYFVQVEKLMNFGYVWGIIGEVILL